MSAWYIVKTRRVLPISDYKYDSRAYLQGYADLLHSAVEALLTQPGSDLLIATIHQAVVLQQPCKVTPVLELPRQDRHKLPGRCTQTPQGCNKVQVHLQS